MSEYVYLAYYQKVYDVIGPGKPPRTVVANWVEVEPSGDLVFYDRWSDSRDWITSPPPIVTRIPRKDWVFYLPRQEEIEIE